MITAVDYWKVKFPNDWLRLMRYVGLAHNFPNFVMLSLQILYLRHRTTAFHRIAGALSCYVVGLLLIVVIDNLDGMAYGASGSAADSAVFAEATAVSLVLAVTALIGGASALLQGSLFGLLLSNILLTMFFTLSTMLFVGSLTIGSGSLTTGSGALTNSSSVLTTSSNSLMDLCNEFNISLSFSLICKLKILFNF